MPSLSPVARSRALNAIFGDTVTLSLLHGDEEESDPGYHRMTVRMIESLNGSARVNAAELLFPPYVRDCVTAVDGWAIYDGSGAEMARGAMEARVPLEGDQILMRAGSVRVQLA
jgi:hypothetical protein